MEKISTVTSVNHTIKPSLDVVRALYASINKDGGSIVIPFLLSIHTCCGFYAYFCVVALANHKIFQMNAVFFTVVLMNAYHGILKLIFISCSINLIILLNIIYTKI